MPHPRILTLILNYRTPDLALQAGAAALRAMEGIAGQLTIVDNDSGDGSFEAMQAAVLARGWSRVQVLQSGHNGGFGAGNNFGIRTGLPDGSAADFVYILNSDAFPDPGAIRALLDTLIARPEIGLAGSALRGPDGVPHQTAFRFPSVWSEIETSARSGPVTRLLRRHVVALPVPQTDRAVDWLAGASLMLRRSMLDEIGLFDETFFLYFEETDLCRRAKAAGWQSVYVPASTVTHIGAVSTGIKTTQRMPGYWFASRLHYFTKTHGRGYAAAATAGHLLGGLIWRTRRLVQHKPRQDPAHFLRDLLVHDLRAALRALRRKPRAAAHPDPRRRP